MTTPIRLQLRRARGFDLQATSLAANGLPAVVVARPGPWGNPFIVGKHGDAAYCVDLYRNMLAGYLRLGRDPSLDDQRKIRDHVAQHGHELRGKNLACWCKPDAPCHADVLLGIVNGPTCEAVDG